MKKIAIIKQSHNLTADIFFVFDDLVDDDKFIEEIYHDMRKIRTKIKERKK